MADAGLLGTSVDGPGEGTGDIQPQVNEPVSQDQVNAPNEAGDSDEVKESDSQLSNVLNTQPPASGVQDSAHVGIRVDNTPDNSQQLDPSGTEPSPKKQAHGSPVTKHGDDPSSGETTSEKKGEASRPTSAKGRKRKKKSKTNLQDTSSKELSGTPEPGSGEEDQPTDSNDTHATKISKSESAIKLNSVHNPEQEMPPQPASVSPEPAKPPSSDLSIIDTKPVIPKAGDVSPEEQGEGVGMRLDSLDLRPKQAHADHYQWLQVIAAVTVILLAMFALYYFTADDVSSVNIKSMEGQAQTWRESNCISILVTGRLSTGKHDLIRALLGEKPKCTRTSSRHTPICNINIHGVCFKVTFWTLPDMADTEYWKEMEGQLRTLDLVIYTLKMDDERLRPEDVSNLHTLSKEFREALWSKGMFVLTFANKVTFLDKKHQVRRSKEFSTSRSNELKQLIRDILISEGISESVSTSIPFVPAGHFAEPLLFDEDDEPWISRLMKCVIVKINSTGNSASGAVWKATKHRMEVSADSTVIKCPLLQQY